MPLLIQGRTIGPANPPPITSDRMNSQDETDLRRSACFATALRKASRRLSQLYDDALEGCGLRSTQYAILSQLDARSNDPPTLAVLADALVIDRSALGHNLRPLERDGLLALVEGKRDRRRKHAVLTAKGRTRLRDARARWRVAQQRFTDVYGARESVALRAELLRIAYDERLGALKG
jgi:DNA-binding MarR family transcriptional regulator